MPRCKQISFDTFLFVLFAACNAPLRQEAGGERGGRGGRTPHPGSPRCLHHSPGTRHGQQQLGGRLNLGNFWREGRTGGVEYSVNNKYAKKTCRNGHLVININSCKPIENGFIINAPLIEISSTSIRESISQGKNMSYFVPKSTWNIIKTMGLYKYPIK